MSSCGRIGKIFRTSRRAASRYTMNSTGDNESPCGVPLSVLNLMPSVPGNRTCKVVCCRRYEISVTSSHQNTQQ